MAVLDASVVFLHQTGLEALVSKALVAVVNERAALQASGVDPQYRLWQLLQPATSVPTAGSAATAAVLRERESKIVDLERQIARLRAPAAATGHSGRLADENLALEEQNAGLTVENEDLKAKNAELQAHIKQLEAHNAELQTENKKAEQVSTEKEKTLDDQAQELIQSNQLLKDKCAALEAGQAKVEAMLAQMVAVPDTSATSAAGPVPPTPAVPMAPPAPPQSSRNLTAVPTPPAAAPARTPNDKAAEVNRSLQGMMARLFDVLDTSHLGILSRLRVKAATACFRQAFGASESAADRAALEAFIKILEQLVHTSEQCSRQAWLEHVRSKGMPGSAQGYTIADAQTFVGILGTILDNDEAVEGLIDAVEDEEQTQLAAEAQVVVTPEYRRMMQRLYDEVLDAPQRSGSVPRARLRDFASALRKGCEASDDDEEREAMLAFVGVLEAISNLRPQCTHQEWQSHVPPPGSFTRGQSERFVEIVSTILDNEEAVDGLLETMSSQ